MKNNRGETHNPILEAQNLFRGVGLKLPYIYRLLFFSWSKIEIGNKGVVGFIYLFGKKNIQREIKHKEKYTWIWKD
jgi:hypothetical protein